MPFNCSASTVCDLQSFVKATLNCAYCSYKLALLALQLGVSAPRAARECGPSGDVQGGGGHSEECWWEVALEGSSQPDMGDGTGLSSL